ncbi:MAG: TetR family transcriptional regulator [Myxococcales bacterium]|nr:TetR family transcriptional regulator [Myxococcales bacterium]
MTVATQKRSTKRARSVEARAERRDDILSAAERLFAEQRFSELHMARLANEIGLAKGTLYLYFPSKESLFLAAVQRSLDAWYAAIGGRLSRHAFIDPDALARELTDALVEQPRLTRLLALLHTVLEQNITEQDAVAFKAFLARKMGRTGIELERLIPALEPGQGARLLLQVHAVVVGIGQASDPSPVVNRALERPDLQHLQMDLPTELCVALSALFRGFAAALEAQGNTP